MTTETTAIVEFDNYKVKWVFDKNRFFAISTNRMGSLDSIKGNSIKISDKHYILYNIKYKTTPDSLHAEKFNWLTALDVNVNEQVVTIELSPSDLVLKGKLTKLASKVELFNQDYYSNRNEFSLN
ncbi:hypothetical protein [Shewanella fidelis]|uniref:Uncharacterized protein n=1 Tax=Shewanella fidelis TaxID=173509 RepID=A0AAW8NGH9_9GAMM|nr:hypothetical protein [Shewanella fidelis]MDR8522458.1 hypothetical protein [Shewanella fidelis]MDW4813008.1 hypothetical protein [Shewanella fidelis]MDW4816733.1 hypothetical protein [Shewanella fidelis]MDW4821015.1 hypothetical protein [Shewanella fidelis]MDW4825450.1 hypothetical protein [Shewanella fidelis]